MGETLCLGICDAFAREARRVAELEDWRDVEIRAFPCACAMAGGTPAASGSPDLPTGPGCDELHVYGGSCTHRPQGGVTVHAVEPCLGLLAPPSLVAHWMERGCYLVTPDWLSKWREKFDAMGFDRPTARRFYGESARSLLLLDTGIEAQSSARLQELAAYLGLPADAVPVGLDHLGSLLSKTALDWRHRRDIARRDESATVAAGRVAEYAMAIDVLERLAHLGTEEDVIAHVVDLFTMLFSPGSVSCAMVERDVPRMVDGSSGHDAEAARTEIERFVAAHDGAGAVSASGKGVIVRISHEREILAALRLDELAFPANAARYAELAGSIAGVCGLALANARAGARLKQLDNERVRSSRMESIGILAAGIAHDINNVLAIIVAHASRLHRSQDTSAKARQSVEPILSAARRAASVVERLLASAASQRLKMEEIDLNELASQHRGILSSILGDRIGLRLELARDAISVQGDSEQLGVVLVNLTTNARDAMPEGGVFTVRTTADSTSARLSISDTGNGMDQKTLAGLFQPYFTTREFGTSAGWGLAVAHGIVEQHGGSIEAASVPSQGSTFTVTLPLSARD
jgi:signal transduction histidine kinase